MSQLQPRKEEIGLVDIFNHGQRLWRLSWAGRGVLLAYVCAAVVVLVLLGATGGKSYQASVKLLPYRESSSASGISGLAGLAGLRVPGGAAGGFVVSSDLYPEVTSTLDFRLALAETKISYAGVDSLVSVSAYFNSIYVRPPVVRARLSVSKFTGLLVGSGSDAVEGGHASRSGQPLILTSEQLTAVNELAHRLQAAFDKRTGIVTISAIMPDPVAAADIVRAASIRLTEIVVAFDVQKADGELAFVEGRFVEAQDRYARAQAALAAFLDNNRSLVTATPQVRLRYLEREEQTAFALVQQFEQEREQARIRRSQDTPVFAVLESATVPRVASGLRLYERLLLGVALGLAFGILHVLLFDFLKKTHFDPI